MVYPARAASGATCVLAGLMVLLAPNCVSAQTPVQTIFQQQADALRAELVCRPPTKWPDLPRRPRPKSIEAAVDSTGVVSYLGGSVVVSITVQLPQYANFFNPTTRVCESVIVLEIDKAGNFTYSRPFAKTAGVAPIVFFDLLGDAPPKLPNPGANSAPEPDPDAEPDPDPDSG